MDYAIFYISYLAFPFAIIIGIFFYKIKDRVIRLMMAGLLALSLFFIYARFIEPKILIVTHEQIKSEQTICKNLRIAVFSDTHFGIYSNGASLKKIVDKIEKEHPDFILIPGDFVTEIKENKIDEIFSKMASFNVPVFAVLGNHDLGIPGEDMSGRLRAAFKKYGVQELDNEIAETELHGCKIKIIGLAELWTGKASIDLLDNLKKDDLAIVLAHNPDTVYKFFKDKNVDLVISGHTHNGQIHLPFVYKFAIPTQYMFRAGFQSANGYNVFVSSGIGMTGLPLRFLTFPEINIIDIQ